MRRILFATFLAFFALFSSHSSLWAQAPSIQSAWLSTPIDPFVDLDFNTKSIILPHTDGGFILNLSPGDNTTLDANPNDYPSSSFIKLSRTRRGSNLIKNIDYEANTGSNTREALITIRLSDITTRVETKSTITALQLSSTSLIASAQISGTGNPTINLVDREIRLDVGGGTFTLTLAAGVEAAGPTTDNKGDCVYFDARQGVFLRKGPK